jgi:hypothetical protein
MHVVFCAERQWSSGTIIDRGVVGAGFLSRGVAPSPIAPVR